MLQGLWRNMKWRHFAVKSVLWLVRMKVFIAHHYPEPERDSPTSDAGKREGCRSRRGGSGSADKTSSLKVSPKGVVNQKLCLLSSNCLSSWAYSLQTLHDPSPRKGWRAEPSGGLGATPLHSGETGEVSCRIWAASPLTGASFTLWHNVAWYALKASHGSRLDVSFSGHWFLSLIHNKLFCRQKEKVGSRVEEWVADNSLHLGKVYRDQYKHPLGASSGCQPAVWGLSCVHRGGPKSHVMFLSS